MVKYWIKEILKTALAIIGFITLIFTMGFCLLGLVVFISVETGSVVLTILSLAAAVFVFVLSFLTGLELATSIWAETKYAGIRGI